MQAVQTAYEFEDNSKNEIYYEAFCGCVTPTAAAGALTALSAAPCALASTLSARASSLVARLTITAKLFEVLYALYICPYDTPYPARGEAGILPDMAPREPAASLFTASNASARACACAPVAPSSAEPVDSADRRARRAVAAIDSKHRSRAVRHTARYSPRAVRLRAAKATFCVTRWGSSSMVWCGAGTSGRRAKDSAAVAVVAMTCTATQGTSVLAGSSGRCAALGGESRGTGAAPGAENKLRAEPSRAMAAVSGA